MKACVGDSNTSGGIRTASIAAALAFTLVQGMVGAIVRLFGQACELVARSKVLNNAALLIASRASKLGL